MGNLYEDFPELRKSWNWKKNGDMRNYTRGSSHRAWWICLKGLCKTTDKPHEFCMPINHRVRPRNCPYCCNQKICPCENACNSVHYLFPELRESWDAKKNGDMKCFTIGSYKKVWWFCYTGLCDTTGMPHNFISAIRDRVKNIKMCSYCRNKKICPCENACNSLWYKKPELRPQWDPKNRDMKTLPPSCIYEANWICDKCVCKTTGKPREWKRSINGRVSKGVGCPYCCVPSRKICECGCNSVWYTNPELRESWVVSKENGDMKTFARGAGVVKDWYCTDCGHIWPCTILNRTNGNGCPNCKKSALEKHTETALNELEVEFEAQKCFIDCIYTSKPMPFDLFLPEYNMLIELQGEQHFSPVNFCNDVDKDLRLKKQKEKDLKKLRYALENGFSFLSISYKTAFRDIKKILADTIDLLIEDTQYCCLHYNLDNYWLVSAIDCYSSDITCKKGVSSVYIEQANLAREILQNL